MPSVFCRLVIFLVVVGAAAFHGPAAFAQEIEKYFKNTCSNCHSIGGPRKVGPDLKDVTRRRDRAWLIRFMQNPIALKESGDPDAVKLFADFPNSIMPAFPDLTAERCESILRLIESESKLDRSEFAGAESKIPTAAFSEQEIEVGREYFVGYRLFANGGAPCLACHSVQNVIATGGGKLGPDLTLVFNRLGGRTGLHGWLTSPPSETMKPIYKTPHRLQEEEIVSLIAYLESAKDGREEATAARFNFFLLGLAGTAGSFVLFDYIWRRRFRAVRRGLVNGQ